MTTMAAAPSFRLGALPAVTVPSLPNAGLRRASFSADVSRGPSSVSKRMGSPLRWGTSIGTISALNLPAAMAASALAWLFAAHSSCSSRVMPELAAVKSPRQPMCLSSKAHHRPSWITPSTSSILPIFWPLRPL